MNNRMTNSILCVGVLATLSAAATPTDQLAATFQAEVEAIRQAYRLPGITAAYALPDGTLGTTASGMADLDSATPMTTDARMLAASIGKSFAAATVIALATEGRLDLDAPVARWLGKRDGFTRLPNHDSMTVRHLLTHSAGLPNHVHEASFATDLARHWRQAGNPFPPDALVAYILDASPLFEAGTGWAYTDTGYILLGLVIEAVTGRTCYEEISARFMHPLKLSATSPSDRRRIEGLVQGYVDEANPFGFPAKTLADDGTLYWHPGIEWMGGGWVSTSGDLARWGAALFGGGALQGIGRDALLDAVPIAATQTDVWYGAGVVIRHGGAYGTTYGHGGWIPGYCSSLRHYADAGVTIAFQINTDIALTGSHSGTLSQIENRLAGVVVESVGRKQGRTE